MNEGRSWFRETFFANPLIERYRFSLLRPATFWIHITMYATIVGLILLINAAIYKVSGDGDPQPYLSGLFAQFLILEIIILWVWASYNAGAALPGEITNRSYDFFKALPLAAHQKAAGIVVGTNLLVYLLGLFTCGALLVLGRLARIEITLQGQILFVVASVTLLFNAAALLGSIQPQKKPRRQTNPLVAMFMLMFFILPMGIQGIAACTQHDIASVRVRFYGAEAPVLIVIALTVLYFSAWTVTGLLRKFTHEREPLFSPGGAFLFVFGFLAVAMGFLQPYLEPGNDTIVAIGWLVFFAPLVFVPGGALKDLNHYIEHARSVQGRPAAVRWIALARYSNVALGLVLFATWAVFAFAAGLAANLPVARLVPHLVVLMSFYAFYLLLGELYVLVSGASPAVKYLLVLVGLLEIILPFVFSPLIGHGTLIFFGPLGYATNVFCVPGLGPVLPRVLLFNLGLMLVPAGLIAARYRRILKLRQEM